MRSGVVSAADVYDLAGFEVIVAGALYANRWHRDARRFVKRNAAALRKLPVWLVSSGPLDESAEQSDIPATPQVRKLAAAGGARGHVTFGGRLAQDAMGFPASAMAKTNAGDWRDPEHVRGCLTGQTPYERLRQKTQTRP
ncbi:MAG: flavodoxin domain-containing protein [Mycobacterium sp.]